MYMTTDKASELQGRSIAIAQTVTVIKQTETKWAYPTGYME